MNEVEKNGLVSWYAQWETSRLRDALGNPGDFDPQALGLIAMELERRGAAAEPAGSEKTPAVPAMPCIGPSPQHMDGKCLPRIPYVGAWGFAVLLHCVFAWPVVMAFRGLGTDGQVEVLAAVLSFAAVLMLVSFSCFWVSVKWMIVDRLTQAPKPHAAAPPRTTVPRRSAKE